MINIRSLDPKESVIAVILLFMLMILLSTISVIQRVVSWLLVEMASVNLKRHFLGWEWIIDFTVGKTQFFLFDRLKNFNTLDVKIARSAADDTSLGSMIMVTNCSCGMMDRRKVWSLISSQFDGPHYRKPVEYLVLNLFLLKIWLTVEINTV